MAIAANGEPLAYRHATCHYSAQTDYGTAVAATTAIGACEATSIRQSSNLSVRGPGSPNRLAVKGQETYSEVSIRFPAVQTGSKTLLTKAFRSSGTVPINTISLGYEDDVTPTSTKSADQIQDCKIARARFSLDASGGNGPLSVDLDVVGGLVTTVTNIARSTLSTTPMNTYEAVLTRGGSAFEVRAWDMEIAHRLSRDHIIPGTAPATFVRGHKYLTEHEETITGNMTLYKRSGVSVQANTVSTAASVLTLTNLVDSVVFTITFATMDFDSEQMAISNDGIFFSVPFQAHTVTFA